MPERRTARDYLYIATHNFRRLRKLDRRLPDAYERPTEARAVDGTTAIAAALGLEEAELFGLLRCFRGLDANGDARVSPHELLTFLDLDPTPLLTRILASSDGDGDGSVDFREFVFGTFGTTKARAVDHGEINARSKGSPPATPSKEGLGWLDPDAESKRNPSSTVVTPFLPPVDEAKAEILEILIERGAPLDIDAATADDLYERGPPLNVALSRGRDILAGRLLDAGADAVAARAAESPLHVACDCGNVAMAAAARGGR
ncbi:hypothetical protein JL722_10863 [Aureococcus anophagefferens]|nr:hypothetical protein JL722_10863 [Aureococcus anophagefferens]